MFFTSHVRTVRMIKYHITGKFGKLSMIHQPINQLFLQGFSSKKSLIFSARYMQDLVQDLASLARKILARFAYWW